MKLSNIKKVRGQGMTEYLIIIALIAVAAITTFGLFSGAARNQVAAIATEVSGGDGAGSTASSVTDATAASTDATTNRGMDQFTTRNDF